MSEFKSKNTRKTVSICATLALCFSALGGMGWGIYNISQTLNRSSDFAEGQSIQFNLRLYQTNADGKPLSPLTPIYADSNTEKQHLETSASALATALQRKNLTNIKVSHGYSTVTNVNFPNSSEKVGTLYATFENSQNAFKLSDVDEIKNEYINNQKIFKSLNDNYRYEFELVKPEYVGKHYRVAPAKTSTGRASSADKLTGMYYDTVSRQASGSNFNMYTGSDTEGNFTASTTDKMKDKVTIKSKQELNTWAFVTDKNNYDSLATSAEVQQTIADHVYGDESWYMRNDVAPIADEPTPQQKYQTNYTWLLWKDKQGLINYLNSLLVLWYYNLYANEISVTRDTEDKGLARKHLDQIFNVNPWAYQSYVDPDTRNKINELISGLSETEKGFIAMAGQAVSSGNSDDPNNWRPAFIEEVDLIPILYNYHNSEAWNPDYEKISETTPSYGISSSVKNGWGWLESANTNALTKLVGDYLVTKVDHKSFSTHFYNANSTDTTTNDPYTTSDVYFGTTNDYTVKDFISILNKNVSFPIITPNQAQFINDYTNISKSIEDLKNASSTIKFDEPNNADTIAFKNKRKAFAETTFNSSSIFTLQQLSKPLYTNSWTGMNQLDLLMIILGAILFIIGIFISIRYRIPGAAAFLVSAFVFVISIVLYNAFGFSFSFYSFIALAFGTFLSLLSPIFLCRNAVKEIKESSTISASIIKSVKKYWKTSLDFHVISILCSLSFLFFGVGGNINFGSMLIVSVFLSFLLSGILFFVLMLFYTQYAHNNTFEWFFAKGYYTKLISLGEQTKQVKIHDSWFYKMWNKFMHSINLANKPTIVSCIVFTLIGVVGVFLLGFLGSSNSLDFKNTNILIIRNFSNFNISANDIIGSLNINAIQSYIYNNELFIYTAQIYEYDQIANALIALNPGISAIINNNVLISTLSTEMSVQIVLNTLTCIGIAIGFSAVWATLSLNIISVLPLAIVQIIPVFILSGFFGAVQFPLQLEITLMMSVIFMINSVIATSSLSALKSSWNRNLQIDKNELYNLFSNIASKINANYLIFIGLFVCLSILSMIFISVSLILVFTCLIIMLAWISFYTNRLIVYIAYKCILLRNIFSNELLRNKDEKNIKINYDFVDEQIIGGINN